ncbi:MAG TPA: STAS domain-containing protein [Tepidisphaeraceae bacterium]|jgi:anti-anti-sigma factor|nr:STAS domain-containing protein [Tepidisphaeraceae bacterium]
MILRTISIDNDGSVRVAADGPLTCRSFKGGPDNPLRTLLGNGWARRKILLDLRRADYFDSFALGWLINCHRELSANGGMMLLHSASPKVCQFLRLLKLETILPIYESETTARAAVARNAA